MSAPLKPWERTQTGSTLHNNSRAAVPLSSIAGGATPSVALNNDEIQGAGRPAIPPRPVTSSSFTPGAYGTGYNMYGSSLGGGYGGMGGMHPSSYMSGGYGMGYSPYNRMAGYNNMNIDSSNSFTHQAEASAQGAFQSVESVVGAVSSVSMMLESTYFALHSSFRAVLGVADQFSRLKLQLHQVAASFAVFKFIKWLFRRLQVLLGLRRAGLSEDAWANAVAKSASEAQQRFPGQQKSTWPFVVFVGLIVFLIKKILNSISGHSGNTGTKWADGTSDHVVGECKYNFTADKEDELSVQQSQRINLAPADLQPRLRENDWLLASDGVKTGIVPASYVRILGTRKGKPGKEISTDDQGQSSVSPTGLSLPDTLHDSTETG